MNSLVSVIIPCFNDGRFLSEAIHSVEKCDRSLFELIIVNDGSTDNLTLQLLKSLEANNYHVIHQQNKGLSAARNTGIRHSIGHYILPLDADNKIKPELILKALKVFAENKNVSVVYSEAEYFGNKTGISAITDTPLNNLFLYNFIDACAIYKKDCWTLLGGYDESMLLGFEDWEFWLRLYVNDALFYSIKEPLYYYRVRNNSLVSISIQPENYIKLREYLITKHAKYYVSYIDHLNELASSYTFDRQRPFRSFCKYLYYRIFNNANTS